MNFTVYVKWKIWYSENLSFNEMRPKRVSPDDRILKDWDMLKRKGVKDSKVSRSVVEKFKVKERRKIEDVKASRNCWDRNNRISCYYS